MEAAPLGSRPVAQHLEGIVRRHPVSDADRPRRLFHDLVALDGRSKLLELGLELHDPLSLKHRADPRLECGDKHAFLSFFGPDSPGQTEEHDVGKR
jgi:hypothetical protein